MPHRQGNAHSNNFQDTKLYLLLLCFIFLGLSSTALYVYKSDDVNTTGSYHMPSVNSLSIQNALTLRIFEVASKRPTEQSIVVKMAKDKSSISVDMPKHFNNFNKNKLVVGYFEDGTYQPYSLELFLSSIRTVAADATVVLMCPSPVQASVRELSVARRAIVLEYDTGNTESSGEDMKNRNSGTSSMLLLHDLLAGNSSMFHGVSNILITGVNNIVFQQDLFQVLENLKSNHPNSAPVHVFLAHSAGSGAGANGGNPDETACLGSALNRPIYNQFEDFDVGHVMFADTTAALMGLLKPVSRVIRQLDAAVASHGACTNAFAVMRKMFHYNMISDKIATPVRFPETRMVNIGEVLNFVLDPTYLFVNDSSRHPFAIVKQYINSNSVLVLLAKRYGVHIPASELSPVAAQTTTAGAGAGAGASGSTARSQYEAQQYLRLQQQIQQQIASRDPQHQKPIFQDTPFFRVNSPFDPPSPPLDSSHLSSSSSKQPPLDSSSSSSSSSLSLGIGIGIGVSLVGLCFYFIIKVNFKEANEYTSSSQQQRSDHRQSLRGNIRHY